MRKKRIGLGYRDRARLLGVGLEELYGEDRAYATQS